MDQTYLDKNRQVLTEGVLGVPGLVMLGHNTSSKAMFPMKMHVHENCLEIVVVIKGNECYMVDGQRYELSGGGAFISYVDQYHSNGDTAQGVSEFIWFQINPYIRKGFLGLSDTSAERIRNRLIHLDTHKLKLDNESIALLTKSFKYFLLGDDDARIYAQSLFAAFISKLLLTRNEPENGDVLMQRTVDYIHSNIQNAISIQELCAFCKISLSGFKHKFKQYTGETPRDYINHRKILEAKKLLECGRSVTETAMLLSFNTSDYFSVVFRKYTACSPSACKAVKKS